MTPSADEIADFRKFLFDNGFTTETNGSNYFRMQFDCGQLLVRLEFTPEKKFKAIEAHLNMRWKDNNGIFGKYPPGTKFYKSLPMGKPVSSLDKEFVKHCIVAAKDSMEEIEATLQKIPAIIHLELLHWDK